MNAYKQISLLFIVPKCIFKIKIRQCGIQKKSLKDDEHEGEILEESLQSIVD